MSLSNIARDCVTGEGRLERRLRFVTDLCSGKSTAPLSCDQSFCFGEFLEFLKFFTRALYIKKIEM